MKKSLFLVVLAVLVAVFAVSCDGESAAAEPKKFTVKFDLKGGTSAAIDDQTVVEGEKAKEPAAPTRDGYTFECWKLGEEAFNFNTPITKDITLVASWGVTSPDPEPEKYTVTFDYDDDGTTANQEIEVPKDSTVKEPEDPTREGYAFKGWYENGATAAFDFNTPITKNITLKAEWAKVHTVTFDVDGGTTVSAQNVEDGNKATKPENPTKTGYRFTGWYEDGAAEAFDFGTAITKNITLKAEWVKTYTVTFNTGSNYASPVDSITVDENSKINKPETNRSGFRFDGWWNGGEEFNFKDTQINTDYTLVAVWTPLFIVKNGVLEPTEVGKTLENVVIPESIDGSPVTEIKQYAFQKKNGIISVEIPSTVTAIGKQAFEDCKGITSVSINEDSMLETIGESAFSGCSSITSVNFGNCSKLATIGASAFLNCTGITSFDIPASVTTIERSAFNGCSNITSVTFGTDSKLTTIGVSAFSNCTGITSFDIPTSVTTIGSDAFNQCNGLTSIVIPSKVEKVNSSAFQKCKNLSYVNIESVSAKYETFVFFGCSSLSLVEFPKNMTSTISSQMFKDCTGLEEITIPRTCGGVETKAFDGCINLGTVRILKEIYDAAPSDAFPSTSSFTYDWVD